MSMSLRKIEAVGAKKAKTKHGIYAFLVSGKLPSGRAWKRTQADVSKIREALIKQYGGDKIQPAVLALVESAIEGLTIQRLAALYVKRAGILRGDSLVKGNLELHSILSGQFISYANLVRLNLEAAARLAGQKMPDLPVPTIVEYIAALDARKVETQAGGTQEAAPGGPGVAQDGQPPADQGNGQGQGAGEGQQGDE
jgi:hypothetical protein